MKLEEHIQILKNLRIRYKSTIIRILWTIFKDHSNQIENIEDFIKKTTHQPEKVPIRQ